MKKFFITASILLALLFAGLAVYRAVEPQVSTDIALQQTSNDDSVAIAMRGYQTVKSNLVVQATVVVILMAIGLNWNRIKAAAVRVHNAYNEDSKPD